MSNPGSRSGVVISRSYQHLITNERLGPRLLVAENDREPRAENPPELFSKPFADVLAAAVDGGHVSVRRAAALVGLPIEGLEELFAVHRVEYVIDL